MNVTINGQPATKKSTFLSMIWICFLIFVIFASWYLQPEPEWDMETQSYTASETKGRNNFAYAETLHLSLDKMESTAHSYTLNNEYLLEIQLTGFWAEETQSKIEIWRANGAKEPRDLLETIIIAGDECESIFIHRSGEYKISGILVGNQYFPERYPGLFPTSSLEISARHIDGKTL